MSDRQLIEAFQKITGTQLTDKVEVVTCSVLSVDVDNLVCDCLAISGEGETEIPQVKLMAEIDDGLIYVPAIGSTVIIALSRREQPFVLMYSELSQIVQTVGQSSVTITDGAIQFNNGSFGGMAKAVELRTQLNTTNELLQALIDIISGAPIPEPGGGAASALQTALKGAIIGKQLGTYTNIINENITHG